MILLSTIVFSQKTSTTNLTTGEKEIEISNGRKIIGESKYKIVLKDSIAKEFGITELPAKKLLFFNKTYSYVESIITEMNDNGYKVRRKYIIRVNNSQVDFEKSKGQDLFFQSRFSVKGFGKYYLTQDEDGELKYNLEKFSKEQRSSILLGLGSSVVTSSANLIYITSVKNPRPINLVTLNLVGGGITIYSIIRYLDSYKYLNRYNFYKESITLEEMKLK